MLNKKLIFLSFCFAFLCLHATGFTLNISQNQEVTDPHFFNNQTDLLTKKKKSKLVYYLYIQDFIDSMINIPTANLSNPSSTIDSKYLAGRAPLYKKGDQKFGICSASFLCMQNQDGIFTDISNYLVIENGLIVTWFTPTTLVNLELDSIINGMVTECIVIASTKVGFNPFYGKKFNMIVSSDNEKIYFKLTPLN